MPGLNFAHLRSWLVYIQMTEILASIPHPSSSGAHRLSSTTFPYLSSSSRVRDHKLSSVMSWEGVDHAASLMGILAFSGKASLVISASIHVWACTDGFEIAYRPMAPVKDRLDDIMGMLRRLSPEDVQQIQECCTASHMSIKQIETEHKEITDEFENMKYERSKRMDGAGNRIKAHIGNIASYVFCTDPELERLRRWTERLHADTMATTTLHTRNKSARRHELEVRQEVELAERAAPIIPDIEAQNLQPQLPPLGIDDEPTDFVRAVFLFDDGAVPSCPGAFNP
ncbi:hypothetical protein PENSPDRAFT_753944 [Peniophora sp. CONT]|nr:hypothetical protein PENSPDRAFT_753944 [Peniophora sp. CONT]